MAGDKKLLTTSRFGKRMPKSDPIVPGEVGVAILRETLFLPTNDGSAN